MKLISSHETFIISLHLFHAMLAYLMTWNSYETSIETGLMVSAFICYIMGMIYESIFQCNKWCIFWTFELRGMAILVEAAQAVGGCVRMKEDS
jgi:hypothetical protein